MENGANLWFSKEYNVGIRRSGRSYILVCNPNTELYRTAIDWNRRVDPVQFV